VGGAFLDLVFAVVALTMQLTYSQERSGSPYYAVNTVIFTDCFLKLKPI
jgi:hypothetical protein